MSIALLASLSVQLVASVIGSQYPVSLMIESYRIHYAMTGVEFNRFLRFVVVASGSLIEELS